MLKLRYYFKPHKQNLKLVKVSFLILNLLLVTLPTLQKKQTLVKRGKTLRTLMLSPFHYKVAKKNIIKRTYGLSIEFQVKFTRGRPITLLLFNHWNYLQIYFIFLGLVSMQFQPSVSYIKKC